MLSSALDTKLTQELILFWHEIIIAWNQVCMVCISEYFIALMNNGQMNLIVICFTALICSSQKPTKPQK